MNFREIAKFLSGLVVGDFLVGLWLYVAGDLPMNFFGIRLVQEAVPWWLGLDAVLFVGLLYYGWGPKSRNRILKRNYNK